MQEVVINCWAVLVCGVASMILGYLWYGPLFGKMWQKLSGHTPQNLDKAAMKKTMMRGYILMFIGSLVMAFALAHSLLFAEAYLKISGASAGLQAGFWSWLGFIAPVSLGVVLWEGKSWKLWFLNNGYNLVQLLMFGLILALWK